MRRVLPIPIRHGTLISLAQCASSWAALGIRGKRAQEITKPLRRILSGHSAKRRRGVVQSARVAWLPWLRAASLSVVWQTHLLRRHATISCPILNTATCRAEPVQQFNQQLTSALVNFRGSRLPMSFALRHALRQTDSASHRQTLLGLGTSTPRRARSTGVSCSICLCCLASLGFPWLHSA